MTNKQLIMKAVTVLIKPNAQNQTTQENQYFKPIKLRK